MMYTLNILISGVIALATFVGAYKYLPLNYFESPQTFGSTITTINGTDTLSSSRSVINTNFANLNTDKMELSDWFATTSAEQITKLGTITTGVWSGTAILPAKGGTGSTTLSSNQVLLGNGTGNIKVVSGYGTSGQFLTSNGASNAPTWTTGSIDQTLDYNFTGTFRAKNLNASSTSANPLVLNGVSYNTPSLQGASSTVLSNDGSGNLTHEVLPWLNIGQVAFSGAATTTLTLAATSTAQDIKIVILGTASGTNSCTPYLQLNTNTTTGVGNNYAYTFTQANAASVSASSVSVIRLDTGSGSVDNPDIHYNINLTNNAAFPKYVTWIGSESDSGATTGSQSVGSGKLNDSTNQLKSVALGIKCDTGGTMTAGRITVYASQN